MARFTREALDSLRERLLIAARERSGDLHVLTTAVAELAMADFRRDPGSAVPLEIACSAAILGLTRQFSSVDQKPNGQASRPTRRTSRRSRSSVDRAPETLSREDRFLKELYERCQTAKPVLAAWLNGSCEVLSMDDGNLELGFYYPIHMQKVANDGRTLVEQKAEELLKRPITLSVRQIDKEPPSRRPSTSGHLAQAAKAMGATPIETETSPTNEAAVNGQE